MKETTGVNINLAVLGGKGCGKSALTVRYLTRRFIGEYDSEKDSCITRNVHIAGKETELNVTDTAACEWMKSPQSLIGWSKAIIIVYSITDESSFDFAKYLLQKLEISKRLDNGCVMLLGNKSDLAHLRKVSYKNAKNLANSFNIHYEETSAACDLIGVQKAFNGLLYVTLTSQITKMKTLKISLETLEEFENACRSLRIRRRSSNDSLRQISGSSDEEGLKNGHTAIIPIAQQKKRAIQIASFLEKMGKINQMTKSNTRIYSIDG